MNALKVAILTTSGATTDDNFGFNDLMESDGKFISIEMWNALLRSTDTKPQECGTKHESLMAKET